MEFREVIKFIKSKYSSQKTIHLHEPVFHGNEKKYITDAIDSTFVSSIGKYVDRAELMISKLTGTSNSTAVVNGTSGIQVALQLAGVNEGDEVLTQALTFVATSNAILYNKASPVFIDVDLDTMGMSPSSLRNFLESNVEKRDGKSFNKNSGRQISACVPMHTFGIPCRIEEIKKICIEWDIVLIEDCAESLGSYVNNQHTGTFGELAILSFNGNKLITTGGGGMIITNDERLAKHAKHITTTSKVPHPFEFVHDEVGYNYRMPNLNAALGCAQMERLNEFLAIKSVIAEKWKFFFHDSNIEFMKPLIGSKANNWLNTIALESKSERDYFLKHTNENGVMTRPIWTLMSKLEMFKHYENDGLKNSINLEERVVNIPSSVPDGALSLLGI